MPGLEVSVLINKIVQDSSVPWHKRCTVACARPENIKTTGNIAA